MQGVEAGLAQKELWARCGQQQQGKGHSQPFSGHLLA